MIGMAGPRKDVELRTWSQDATATAAPRDWWLAIKRGEKRFDLGAARPA